MLIYLDRAFISGPARYDDAVRSHILDSLQMMFGRGKWI
jgi:hypothetical protein